ncbi:hypothetical protein MD484_g6798, partial [Candolleomyces efflorescens]
MEGIKRRRSVEIEEVPDIDAPPSAPLRPPSRKSASSEQLFTKKEEKKRRSVEIEEVLDEDAPRASTSRLDPPKPTTTKGKMKRKCSVEMEEVLDEDAPRGSPSRSESPKPPSAKGKMKQERSGGSKTADNEDSADTLLDIQRMLAALLAQSSETKGKKKQRDGEMEEEVTDEDSPQNEIPPSRADLQKIASHFGLPAQDVKGKKKADGPETDQAADKDAAEGTSSRPHARVAPKEHPDDPTGGLKHSPEKSETMPCGHMKDGRNLIICIDGTANQFGKKNTNVIELYNLILKEMGQNQHTWYNSGIGTYARPHWRSVKYLKQIVVHKIDLAIAWNFERTVQAAYRWLADNYQDGDCIFLFGFSRGAFQVRALAGMIEKVGLIHKGNEVQIPFAYELYADPKSDVPEAPAVGSSSTDKWVSMAQRFKEAFSRQGVTVHFVGVWDTVSSIGVARGKRVLPLTTDGMTHVCYFRHALALDERRVKFIPEFAWGGTTMAYPETPQTKSLLRRFWRWLWPLVDGATSERRRLTHGDHVHPQVLEVWFPGTHSDIGGGNAINAGMDRSRPPLRWMASQAKELGLRIGSFKRELLADEQIEFQESLTGPWHLFEMLPFQRLTLSRRTGKINGITRKPHLWSPRKIHEGQKIHFSFVLGRENTETNTVYVPKADPFPDATISLPQDFWADLSQNRPPKWLESDAFYVVADLLKKLLEGGDVLEEIKKEIAAEKTALQILYEQALETARTWDEKVEKEANPTVAVQHRFLQGMVDVFELENNRQHLKISKWRDHPIPLVDLRKSDSEEHREFAARFLREYVEDVNCLFELRGHSHHVSTVAISLDGKRIVSGSWDGTIRIWDMEKGEQVGSSLRGHDSFIRSVAISPNGELIVSSSDDRTVRVWDAKTATQVGESIQGHEARVWSVAFSHDGKRIVSGSFDRTIRIWEAVEELRWTQVGDPIRGHDNWIRTIAISPDDKYIVSGSDDRTIRIWDAKERRQVGELRGHKGYVFSAAISPDGKRIVSGSYDNTIRIWDVEKREQVGELQGHSETVRSVAISPDGKYIVSGSEDGTIWIWDLEKREQVGEPLRGHAREVSSVAISSDGKRIVSGSDDRTVRIWSAEGLFI